MPRKRRRGSSARSLRRKRMKEVGEVLSTIRQEDICEKVVSEVTHPQPYDECILISELDDDTDIVDKCTSQCNTITAIQSNVHEEHKLCEAQTSEFLEMSIAKKIRRWAVIHNINHVAIKDLLQIFNLHFPLLELPRDPRTLMQTPRNLNISKLSGGSFIYFGLVGLLEIRVKLGVDIDTRICKSIYSSLSSDASNLLTLTVGIDGIPVSESTNKQFWPILGMLDQCISTEPFIIGLYFGDKKPSSLEFLNSFISDCKELENNGLVVDGVTYQFRISKILADAPARSFIKAIRNHNSYYSCERCNQRGEWCGRVVFSNEPSIIRSDQSFRTKRDNVHHNGDSVFLPLKLDMVNQFPLDYLHLVCLGVVRKILRQWVKGKLPHKLRPSVVAQISDRLLNFKKQFPVEFQRKPRPLSEVDHYKGTEYRSFLLYTGLPALKNIIDKKKYKHFILLHSAMFILLSKYCDHEWWNRLAMTFLSKFVTMSIEIYGREFVTYNVHSLTHIANDCLEYGVLDNCSTFKFESFMQQVKRMVRSNSFQLEQVANRLTEKGLVENLCFVGPSDKTLLSPKVGNNCFMTKSNKIILIKRRLGNISSTKFECVECMIKEDVKDYPFQSSMLGIYFVKQLSNVFTLHLEPHEIRCKFVHLPYSSSFICIPLLHSVV